MFLHLYGIAKKPTILKKLHAYIYEEAFDTDALILDIGIINQKRNSSNVFPLTDNDAIITSIIHYVQEATSYLHAFSTSLV